MALEFYYGIFVNFSKGNLKDLLVTLTRGNSVIFLCTASKLSYFPRNMLGLEASGFQHSILICGWNQDSKRFLIVDPMVDFIGEINEEELIPSGYRRSTHQELLFFEIGNQPEHDFQEPTAEHQFAFASMRNNSFFETDKLKREPMIAEQQGQLSTKQRSWMEWFSNRHSGGKALEMFAKDLTMSKEWPQNIRSNWIDKNILTISSITLIRKLVWNSYSNLNVMKQEQEEAGENQMQQITIYWQNLNIKLMRYKQTSSNEVVNLDPLLRNINQIKTIELEFLKWMEEVGRSIYSENGESTVH
ncbi:hypothetical protein [Cohnella endophytica]|nr:hypothetical protein [Cohnella endophytica]